MGTQKGKFPPAKRFLLRPFYGTRLKLRHHLVLTADDPADLDREILVRGVDSSSPTTRTRLTPS